MPGDDYAMMREVLTRRFKRLLKEHGLPAGEAAADDQPLNSISPARTGEEQGSAEEELPPPVESDDGDGVSLDEAEDEAEAQGGDVGAWPDLVIIDGGAGQLSAAQEVLAELGLHGLRLVAIAKGPDRNAGRERFFMPNLPPFSLEPRDPGLYFVQRLRDEAHRFAIGSHRAKRKKVDGRKFAR